MNIKPTKKKLIWTFTLGIIINILVPLVNWFTSSATWSLAQRYMNISQTTGLFQPAEITTLISYLFSKWNLIALIVELILIYLIWSILQKSRRHMRYSQTKNLKQK